MHSNLVADLYDAVLNAPSVEAYKVELIKFANQQGFDLAATDYRSPPPHSRWTGINNYTLAWMKEMEKYLLLPNPINDAGLAAKGPVLWDLGLMKQVGMNEIAEAVAPHGFHSGIDMPVVSAAGGFASVNFSRSSALPVDRVELVRVTAEMSLFASFAIAALDRLLGASTPGEAPTLTPREFEVMKWAVAGKTALETGMILSCAERTVNFHMQNILRKFDVVNKQAAIAKALQLKIVL
jgi:LuxR family transcriptional regulator, quorum-sensing system regulator LasR